MRAEVIVAGHICLDIIPTFARRAALDPGKLIKVGPAVMATGGAVSNTGIALHRLGARTRLMGKVGDDAMGRTILDLLRGIDPALAESMIVAPGETSSYSVVISPPQTDRTFLHCTGANDTFIASDVTDAALAGARLFHFGYPTLMRAIHADGGEQMETIFCRARQHGLVTSLDMSLPDPESEAGRVDWPAWLQRVLPHVDLYLPSLEETQFMLGRQDSPGELARQLEGWGAGIVGLKMGAHGLFCRWGGCDRHAPCFEVDVVGTTGSGDATIAGFLSGYLRGLSPEDTMTAAVATGACCCEAADATSGIQSWEAMQQRIAGGWRRLAARGGGS